LHQLTGHSLKELTRWLHKLVQLGLMQSRDKFYSITEQGLVRANQLIRAHRLWETFLVDQLGLQSDQIHEDADHIEHHLSEEDLLRLDEQLGYPDTDPHGSPIPKA
jgi:Mn-dependent DtxR family transcriptional regulator